MPDRKRPIDRDRLSKYMTDADAIARALAAWIDSQELNIGQTLIVLSFAQAMTLRLLPKPLRLELLLNSINYLIAATREPGDVGIGSANGGGTNGTAD